MSRRETIPLAAREGFESNVDLFGEQTVQVVTATLQAVFILLAAGLLMVLSVRAAQASVVRPALATLPGTGRLLYSARNDLPSCDALRTSLPTRAPPGFHNSSSTSLSRLGCATGLRSSTLRAAHLRGR
ncbi:MAG: hypothetical protein ABIP55_07085 [Tepidisphaeraceae bacterium]